MPRAERTTNAHLFQRQFAAIREPHFNIDQPFCPSESSPMPTEINGRTRCSPIPPSLNQSEESGSSLTPAPQQGSVTLPSEASLTGVSTASPTMPMKPTQDHRAISIPSRCDIQNDYTAAMSNEILAFLPPSMQQDGLPVQLNQLKNASTIGQPEMAIAVNGSRPASYIGYVVGNRADFNLPVGSISVNVGTNMNNMNL